MAIIYLWLYSNQKKIQKLLSMMARTVLKAKKQSHIVDLLNELYWLYTTNFFEYLLTCSMRRLRERLMRAPVSFGKDFKKRDPALYRLRSVHL